MRINQRMGRGQDWRAVAKVAPLDEVRADPEGGDKDEAGNGGSVVKMRNKRWNFFCLSSSIFFKMAQSKTFSTCVYSTIIVSSVMLAIETPAEQVSRMILLPVRPSLRLSISPLIAPDCIRG
jgi:hypothetical protein